MELLSADLSGLSCLENKHEEFHESIHQKVHNFQGNILTRIHSAKFGCGFSAYSWKLPAYSGAFLLTVDNFSFFLLTVRAFPLTVLASLLTVGAFLLTMGKCV